MDALSRLGPDQLRVLYSLSLYRGSTSELDLLPMQPAAMRPFTAAKALSDLAADYPGVLDRSRAVGMRDAVQGELVARRAGVVELPPALRQDLGAPADQPLEQQRAA